jgi:CubicO group peptidase (beta-lactamase class C family)
VPGVTSKGTLRDTVDALARAPLACDPGTQWIYSMAPDVAGYLCEVFSGQSFDRFLQERLFDPLGMTDTAFYVDPSKLDRFAANYELAEDGNGLQLADAPATSEFASSGTYFSGVGGLTSTGPDYMRLSKALANGGELDGERVLGRRTVEYMTRNHLPGGADLHTVSRIRAIPAQVQPGTGFGLGFAVLLDPAEAHVMGSPGEYYWWGAAGTQFFVSPRDELVVIFMTQIYFSQLPLSREIRVAAYQALTD